MVGVESKRVQPRTKIAGVRAKLEKKALAIAFTIGSSARPAAAERPEWRRVMRRGGPLRPAEDFSDPGAGVQGHQVRSLVPLENWALVNKGHAHFCWPPF